jgi:hypothetical protein
VPGGGSAGPNTTNLQGMLYELNRAGGITGGQGARSTYGRPRLADDLRDAGIKAGGKRLARLML